MCENREEAKSQNLLKYFDGVICQNGHLSERYTSNGECVECCKDRHQLYGDTAKQRTERARKSRAHKEKMLNSQKETIDQYLKRREISHKYRNYIFETDNFTAEDLKRIFAKQEGECAGCFTSFENVPFEVDHKIPVKLGGSNAASNIQLLCGQCNASKGDTPPDEWKSNIRYRQVIEYLMELYEQGY